MLLGTLILPCEGIMIHFVTALPESTAWENARITSRLNKLTKMAMCFICRRDINLPELAFLFLEYVMWKLVIPDNLVTYCGIRITS